MDGMVYKWKGEVDRFFPPTPTKSSSQNMLELLVYRKIEVDLSPSHNHQFQALSFACSQGNVEVVSSILKVQIPPLRFPFLFWNRALAIYKGCTSQLRIVITFISRSVIYNIIYLSTSWYY